MRVLRTRRHQSQKDMAEVPGVTKSFLSFVETGRRSIVRARRKRPKRGVSLSYHLQNAKAHGVTKEEIAAIITHATMYVGWPKGCAVFHRSELSRAGIHRSDPDI